MIIGHTDPVGSVLYLCFSRKNLKKLAAFTRVHGDGFMG
jgi:hypothetical protein